MRFLSFDNSERWCDKHYVRKGVGYWCRLRRRHEGDHACPAEAGI